ncbi:MAG: dephospho-CoA kinase [Parahaliea sp.]
MKVVGITGGIGSGKSALTRILEERGITVVDADVVARQVVEPGTSALAAIAECFGPHILQADGGLDRAALRKLVFADPAKRQWLEHLTHPLIGAEIQRQLAAATSPYTVLSSPLLLEGNQSALVEKVIVVDVPMEVQVSRTMSRDDNDETQVRRIIAAQMDRQARLARADWVVDNSGTLAELEQQARQLHRQLLNWARG